MNDQGDRPGVNEQGTDRAWTQEQVRLAGGLLPYLTDRGWIESSRRQESVDRNGQPIPWITYPALDFLERRIRPDMTVFEFGGGNSTLWWAQRTRHVTTAEHDASWASRLIEIIPSNVKLTHVRLVKGGDYSQHAKRSGGQYHIIVVDGRDRVNCAVSSVHSLRPDGVIVWDNTERRRYDPGIRALGEMEFRHIEFRGPAPINTWESETSVFYRPGNCLGI
jgi:hypothetical protein